MNTLEFSESTLLNWQGFTQTMGKIISDPKSVYNQLPERVKAACSGVLYTGVSLTSITMLGFAYQTDACQTLNRFNFALNCSGNTTVSLAINVGLPVFALSTGYKAYRKFIKAMT